MNIEDLEILFSQHPEIGLIRRELGRGKDTHVLVSGLHASARALALDALNAPLFIILDNSEAAQYLYADLKNIKNASGNQNTEVFFFPHSQKRRAVDEAAQIQRTETGGLIVAIILLLGLLYMLFRPYKEATRLSDAVTAKA